ncbi:MAG: hypothetical protein RR234_05520, partial [Christensenella sp.]
MQILVIIFAIILFPVMIMLNNLLLSFLIKLLSYLFPVLKDLQVLDKSTWHRFLRCLGENTATIVISFCIGVILVIISTLLGFNISDAEY